MLFKTKDRFNGEDYLHPYKSMLISYLLLHHCLLLVPVSLSLQKKNTVMSSWKKIKKAFYQVLQIRHSPIFYGRPTLIISLQTIPCSLNTLPLLPLNYLALKSILAIS